MGWRVTVGRGWLVSCGLAWLLGLGQTVLAADPTACPAVPTSPVTTTPVPGTDKFADRYADIRARLRTRHFGVVALGDSLVHGWPQPLLDVAAGEPVLNVGFGADKTENVLWRLHDLDWSGQSPRAVVLLIGTGNIGHTVCNIIAGLTAVVGRIHTTFPTARLYVISLLPRGVNMAEHDEKLTTLNHDLARQSAAGKFTFVDIHDRFLCDHRTPCALFVPDNLHLSRQGYEVLTAALQPLLAR